MDEQPVDLQTPLKQRLLQAALDSLRDLGPVALLNAVGGREIARRAGGSAASINHHYGSMAGLAEEVVAHVYDPSGAPIDGITALLEQVENSHLPLSTAFAMHGAEFDRLTSDPEFHLRMGLWAFGGQDVVGPYRHYLQTIDAQVVRFADRLFASWGRQVRPPFDLATYVAVKVGLINGNTLRQLVDPDPRRRTHFQRATVALDMVLLRVAGDRHTTDDRLSEMNYYPLDKDHEAARTSRSRTTRGRILHVAAELFTTRGYGRTTLDQIAQQSDVSASTLHRHFSTKHEVAVELFRQQAVDLMPHVPEDVAPGESLEAFLSSLAGFTHTRASYASEYLRSLVSGTGAGEDDPLLQQALLHVTRDPEVGEAPEWLSAEYAEMLVGLVVRRVLLHPVDSPAVTASHVLTHFRYGVAGRSTSKDQVSP